jgi:hypothetical protein
VLQPVSDQRQPGLVMVTDNSASDIVHDIGLYSASVVDTSSQLFANLVVVFAPNPKRGGDPGLFHQNRAGFQELVFVLMCEPIDRRNDLEFFIEAQQCLKQVLLAPHVTVIKGPVLRIIARRKNIVDMYQHTRLHRRDQLQQLKNDIPLGPDHM